MCTIFITTQDTETDPYCKTCLEATLPARPYKSMLTWSLMRDAAGGKVYSLADGLASGRWLEEASSQPAPEVYSGPIFWVCGSVCPLVSVSSFVCPVVWMPALLSVCSFICQIVCRPTRLSICLLACLSACPLVNLSVCVFLSLCLSSANLSVFLPFCLSNCLYACTLVLSVCPFACLPTCLSAHFYVCLLTCMSVCLSAHLSVCLRTCLSVCLSD